MTYRNEISIESLTFAKKSPTRYARDGDTPSNDGDSSSPYLHPSPPALSSYAYFHDTIDHCHPTTKNSTAKNSNDDPPHNNTDMISTTKNKGNETNLTLTQNKRKKKNTTMTRVTTMSTMTAQKKKQQNEDTPKQRDNIDGRSLRLARRHGSQGPLEHE